MSSTHQCSTGQPCPVPPHPQKQIPARPQGTESAPDRPVGLNDGALFPISEFSEGTALPIVSQFAQTLPVPVDPINIIVVLANFQNKSIAPDKVDYLKKLFFNDSEFPAVDYTANNQSQANYTSNSVTNFYKEVSGGQISFNGNVVGPYTLDHPVEWYANGFYGGGISPSMGLVRASSSQGDTTIMASHALDKVIAANEIDLKQFDNKGRFHGFIDAFIAVHAGDGGEEAKGHQNDTIWSCKWALPGTDARVVNCKDGQTVKVSPFLTIPETAKLGVCCHEIGHLIFGWPDFYDIGDSDKAGVGPWCLMGGGSWNGTPEGATPCHPSAWCKVNAKWVTPTAPTANGPASLSANVIKSGSTTALGSVERLWTNGDGTSQEYFLLENRQQTGFDKGLPGNGLLVWHVDDGLTWKTSESNTSADPHYHLSLVDASGAAEITDAGSANTPFPGGKNNTSFTGTSNPNSHSYAGKDTHVSVTGIPNGQQTMAMQVGVA